MKFTDVRIVFQEIPNEISLAYLISGCPLQCKGCHSSFAWHGSRGQEWSVEEFQKKLHKYSHVVTCLLFLGGEWHEEELVDNLKYAHAQGLKTALYTGREEVSSELLSHLDYIKLGPWIAERGGLESSTTNQRLIEIKTGKILNHLMYTSRKD
jgi:anaerobic ribonucleoside-triphosphate reductase activating protein